MTRQETLNIMLAGIIEDMSGMYSRSGMSDEEKNTYLAQANESFKSLCTNMYDRLLAAGVIIDA